MRHHREELALRPVRAFGLETRLFGHREQRLALLRRGHALAHVLDAGGPDALAATLEGDGSGAIYPVIYSRIGGRVVEHAIAPDPLMRFDTLDARRAITDLVGRVTARR